MANTLTAKQKRFCQEYVIDLNGKQAAIRSGYTEHTAEVQASRLLSKAKVKQFVKKLQAKIGRRLEITADMVIAELGKVGFYNVHDFLKTGNEIRDLSLMDRESVAPISGVKVTEIATELSTRTTTEIKFHDKVSALEKIGRHLGIFEKHNKQQTDLTVVWHETHTNEPNPETDKGAKGT